MLDFLPYEFKDALTRVNMQFVYEIRMRADKPTTVNYGGKYLYLTKYGIKSDSKDALKSTREQIADTVFSAGKFSVYSVEEQIRQGFLTAENGERIGLAGHFVFENGKPLTVRDFTSLCIRVPHEVLGSAKRIYELCFSEGLCNLLIASPPGLGKTTVLRDISRLICKNTQKNVLICDERGEIAVGDTGETCDIVSFADKTTAFEAGVRAMRPEVMITDELSEKDIKALKDAMAGGVKVIASAHFENVSDIKMPFAGTFDKYVLLDGREIGKIKGVYDKALKEYSAW